MLWSWVHLVLAAISSTIRATRCPIVQLECNEPIGSEESELTTRYMILLRKYSEMHVETGEYVDPSAVLAKLVEVGQDWPSRDLPIHDGTSSLGLSILG